MFLFVTSAKLLFMPPGLIALGMGITFLLLRRHRHRAAQAVLCLTLVLYVGLSLAPVAYILARGLETFDLHRSLTRNGREQAIVILGGDLERRSGVYVPNRLNVASMHRLERGIALYHEFHGVLPLFYTSGPTDPTELPGVETALASGTAVVAGVVPEQIWQDGTSRNTYENGLATQKMLKEHFPAASEYRIILVTSAQHMPRSIRVMKKHGITAVPESVDETPEPFQWSFRAAFPTIDSFSSSITSLNEWVGLIGYWVTGRL